MDREEMILVLTRSVRKLGNMKGAGALDRAKEIRSLIAMIEELKGGKRVEAGEGEESAVPSENAARVEKWKNKRLP
jgi:hypothetical protein